MKLRLENPAKIELEAVPLPNEHRLDRPRLIQALLPTNIVSIRYQVWRFLLNRHDHNWRWITFSKYFTCSECDKTTDRTLIHELFTSTESQTVRKMILKNLLDFLTNNIESVNSQLKQHLDNINDPNVKYTCKDYWEVLNLLINPTTDPLITSDYCISHIRTFLILLAAATCHKLEKYKYSTYTKLVQTKKQDNNMYSVDYEDYMDRKLYALGKINNIWTYIKTDKFKYYTIDENVPILGSATDRKDNPTLNKKANLYAESVIERHKNKIHVYTDGSVKGPKHNRSAGYGVVIVEDNNGNCCNKQTKIKENRQKIKNLYTKSINISEPSIAVAEASAILDALTWLSNNLSNINKDIIMFCDNKYVVNISNLLSKVHYKHKQLARKIQQKIFEIKQDKQIKVTWLPAHCDIILHDEADELACQGADSVL